jgi:hypothetical protein
MEERPEDIFKIEENSSFSKQNEELDEPSFNKNEIIEDDLLTENDFDENDLDENDFSIDTLKKFLKEVPKYICIFFIVRNLDPF